MAPRKLPPNVERWRDRHGHSRVYFREGKGPRVSLPAEIGSPEFQAAYRAAMLGLPVEKTEKGRVVLPGTVGALVASYMASAAYVRLRATTKIGYARRLASIQDKHGHRSISGLSRERIALAFLQPLADRPGEALSILKLLRILVRHAIERGWLKHDPTLGLKRPKIGEIRAWTDEEIARFEARWPVGTKQRLAFALMLFTGQRRSDVHRMSWEDDRIRAIRVVQQKTGERLAIAVHSELRKILDDAPREHKTILATAYGAPFTVAGFSQFMREAITAAGLPLECQPHGLRKAAGRRLAEAGCSA
ncbi:tyrosine-type recombinase/integrase [Methylocella sp.]|uniref:tyrosine-type recombinase/integrase n=1 Tax=Methylocella sp. TaxID=1978226 RepID=UPI003784DDC4